MAQNCQPCLVVFNLLFLFIYLTFCSVLFSVSFFSFIFRDISILPFFFQREKSNQSKIFFLDNSWYNPLSVISETGNRGHNVSELFDILPNFFFTSNATERDYPLAL